MRNERKGKGNSVDREESFDISQIRRVTSAVSSKTSYLVTGENSGESKIQKAHDLGVTLINEDQLLKLIRTLPAKAYEFPKEMELHALSVDEPKRTASPSSIKKTRLKEESVSQMGLNSTSVLRKTTPSIEPKDILLWTEKYRPLSFKDFIGNKTNVEKLVEWLRSWHTEKGDNETSMKAVLLSGPPGIGKTTAALLATREAEYDPIELNASDTRSKKALGEIMNDMIKTENIYASLLKQKASTTTSPLHFQKKAIIMDEVDGMSSGDRGGIGELIKYIKKTQVPIICICNDRAHPKIRNLANYCLDLRFRRPDANQIRSRIMTIAFRENLELKPNTIDELVANTQGDIRHILNALSAWKLKSSTMSFDDAKSVGTSSGKDFEMNPFEIVRKFLSGQEFQKQTLDDLIGLYFYDSSLIPLMVHENYLHVAQPQLLLAHRDTTFSPNPREKALQHLELISQAADAISIADMVDQRIHKEQEWGLAPDHAFFSCVLPGYFIHGILTGRIDFPSWLGNYSKEAKAQRLLRDIYVHMRLRISADHDELRSCYPVFREELSKPLIVDGMVSVDVRRQL
jgi:replication factor C subunit 1